MTVLSINSLTPRWHRFIHAYTVEPSLLQTWHETTWEITGIRVEIMPNDDHVDVYVYLVGYVLTKTGKRRKDAMEANIYPPLHRLDPGENGWVTSSSGTSPSWVPTEVYELDLMAGRLAASEHPECLDEAKLARPYGTWEAEE